MAHGTPRAADELRVGGRAAALSLSIDAVHRGEPRARASEIRLPMMKCCPFCAENIRAAAIICRFCQRDLPSSAGTRAADFEFATPPTPLWLAPTDEPCLACGRTVSPGAAAVLRAAALAPTAGAPLPTPARDWRTWALGLGIVLAVAGASWIALVRRPGTEAQRDAGPAGTATPAGNPILSAPEPPGDRGSRTVSTDERATAPISVRADELAAAYQRNEIAGDRLYRGRVVEIAGPVGWVGRDAFGNAHVTLGADPATSVLATFAGNAEQVLADLSPGQQIVVRCRVDRMLVRLAVRECGLP